jgi:hypothetical protein
MGAVSKRANSVPKRTFLEHRRETSALIPQPSGSAHPDKGRTPFIDVDRLTRHKVAVLRLRKS